MLISKVCSGEESLEELHEEMQNEDSFDDVCYAGNIVESKNRFGYWKKDHFYALTLQKQRYEVHTKIGMISLFTLSIPKTV